MSDLYELLAPYSDVPDSPSSALPPPSANDPQTSNYLNRLSTISIADLTTTEPSSLLHAAQSHIRTLQALSERSHKAVIASASHLANLTALLPSLSTQAHVLRDGVPELEEAATLFARKHDRSTENAVLDRRKRAMLLTRNVDRVSDVLELPSLLSSTVAAAQTPTTTGSAASSTTSYASALDLHAHIKRLGALYPQSQLVGDISKQAEAEIENLTAVLITALQSPQLKLAAGMRTIGWLRRVAPDLAEDGYGGQKAGAVSMKSLSLSSSSASAEGALGSLLLVCRLRMLNNTLEALEPLRELADQETSRRKYATNGTKGKTQHASQSAALGSQSERYLKRYIEIFREQSFAIISMYKSIFPSGLPSPETTTTTRQSTELDTPHSDPDDPLLPLPSPLASFALHLVHKLTSVLRTYMPNLTDKSARESLLTQVLYCAGSLGRLGADFSLVVAGLEDGEVVEADEDEDDDGNEDLLDGETADEDTEWVQVMRKHRIQASRLEVLARGVGSASASAGRKGSGSADVVLSSPVTSPAG